LNNKTSYAGGVAALKKPKNLAVCAMLAALSVIFARLIVPMPNAFTRFSIEAIPIVIAGVLFGPLAGGVVGFVADLVGCLFSGFGYNPIFCVPPILYGVLPGLMRFLLFKKTDLLRIALVYLPPVVIGSILYQSWSLATVYTKPTGFSATLTYFLTTRSIQFAVTFVIDVVLTWLLFRSGLFARTGLWKAPKETANGSDAA
jgi:ECF transporter S component (folate family)